MASREPLQVDPEFKKELASLRKRLLAKLGDEKKVSYTKITKAMSKTNIFKEVEKILLSKENFADININIDRRIR